LLLPDFAETELLDGAVPEALLLLDCARFSITASCERVAGTKSSESNDLWLNVCACALFFTQSDG
jgi:hypothetical protein